MAGNIHETGQFPLKEVERKDKWDFPQLQHHIDIIYKGHDEACGYGPDTMLAKLIGNAVTLKKAAGKDELNLEAVDRALTNVFVWTSTVANKADLSLFRVVGEKYLAGCPRCHSMPCDLALEKPCVKNDKPFQLPFIIPYQMDQLQKYFAAIYPNNFKMDPRETLKLASGRVFDEIGELVGSTHRDVERELGQLSQHHSEKDEKFPWEGEIADVIAWAFATAEALSRLTGGYSVEKSLREKYSKGCPYCKSPKCVCPKEQTIIEELSRREAP